MIVAAILLPFVAVTWGALGVLIFTAILSVIALIGLVTGETPVEEE